MSLAAMAGYEIGVQICEGLEVTNDRPSVERGDWFRTAVGKNTVAACIVSLVMDGLETSLEEHILALLMMFGKAVCL